MLVAPPALSLQDDVEGQHEAEVVVVLAGRRRDGEIVRRSGKPRHRGYHIPDLEAELVTGADRRREARREGEQERASSAARVNDDLPFAGPVLIHELSDDLGR